MADQKLFQKLYDELHAELGIKVFAKDTKYRVLWKFIGKLLAILSFGKMETFYENFTTTIGRGIYYPAGWRIENADSGDYEILRHEAVHVRQYLKLGMGNVYLGILVMGLLYIFVPLPIGLAWCRYRLERVAYLESCKACIDLGLKPSIDYYVKLLSGPSYLWTWPFPSKIHAWFEANLEGYESRAL
jgi:hypothetical protein